MAPSPSSPFSRSSTKALGLGHRPLARAGGKERLDHAQHPVDAAEDLGVGRLLVRRLGQCRTSAGGTVKSSATPTPRGFFALGFSACRISSGTITVRAQ